MLHLELPYCPAILILDTYPEELKTETYADTCTLMLIAALLIVTKMWKQPSVH